jgi:hypothetical protein
MYVQISFLRLSLISEIVASHDQNLELMVNKSDNANNLLLQSLFDRQIQEYIHSNCQIPIEIYDRYMYRLNSLIIHHPSHFDKHKHFLDKNRFISEMEYYKFSLFFFKFLC